MRLVVTTMLLFSAAGTTLAQTARCRLDPRPYGLGGLCRVDHRDSTVWLRIPFPDSAPIWMTSRPRDPPPWRGNLSLPGVEVSFEIAPQGSTQRQGHLVLRSGLFWLPVTEWRESETVGPTCVSCDRKATSVLVTLDLVEEPPPIEDDLVILRRTLAGLATMPRWNREEAQSCGNGDEAPSGLFCLLYASVEARMGRYHHRQPAVELVRAVIMARWRERVSGHPIVDFNNHPATTRADLRDALERALARAQAQAK